MLDEMKEVGESEHSRAVVKTESSYERLIIKKKELFSVEGVLGFSDSSSRNISLSNKERKRSRVVLSDSESSDDLAEPPLPRKLHKTSSMVNKDPQTEKRVNKGLDLNKSYYESDERRTSKDINNDRHKLMLYRQIEDQKDSGSGSSRMIIDKKRDLYSENKGTMGAMEDDELGLSVSKKEHHQERVRMQGKNGVLMVNKHKPVGVLHRGNGHGESKGMKEHRTQILDGKSSRLSHNIHDQQEANQKRSMKQSSSLSSFKRPANPTVSKGNKEGKIKRASYTEKQLLREKIKNMLLNSGWTIDYRPRRNRDYLDSVYISPTGNGYWSITKAYEALRKEEKDKSKGVGDFTPLPSEILKKLTRQTQKKLEREIEKNRGHEENSNKSKRVKKSARLKEASEDSNGYLSDDSHKETQIPQKDTFSVPPNFFIVQKSGIIGRRTMVVRGSDKGFDFVPYSGNRTVLSWLIDSGVVSVDEKVEYMNLRRTRVMQEGRITEDGIRCGCCSKIVTVSRFELHAGSRLGQPLKHITLQSGQSLMQCQIDAWNKQKESERKGFHGVKVDGDDPNDDTCCLCGDGGDLICCDGCPSTFHLTCLDIQMLPEGDWHCPNCACKYCKIVCSKASGRTESSLLTCRLCVKKYHKSCSPEMDDMATDSNHLHLPFCGQKCQKLYSRLHKLLWIKHELDSGFSWSLIHRSDQLPDVSSVNFYERAESISKLAIALLVMDECFLPILDRRSGANLIHNVVYNCGSNFSRLNYSGFFTAVLERGDEMICAASIRIHGTQLAEMPFIGTRNMYRRQGMCGRLLHAIESALASLKVEKLVIPAIEEHMHTWTNAFGFSPVEESHKQEMRSFNMVVFPGTDMLQKPLIKQTKINSEKDSIPSKNMLRTKRTLSLFTKGVEVQDYKNGDSNVLKGVVQTPPGISDDTVCSDVSCEPQLQNDIPLESGCEGNDVQDGRDDNHMNV